MAGLVLTVSWTQISERRQNKRRFYHMALVKQRVEIISSSVFRFGKNIFRISFGFSVNHFKNGSLS